MKLSKGLKDSMAVAIEQFEGLIAERVEEDNSKDKYLQQTNIFKILRLENHEIRHGAFLNYLIDPDRNPQLAHYFIRCWLEQVAEDLSINDSAINDIVEGREFSIGPIVGEFNYSEILIPDNKNRIDCAFELRVGNRRRAIVFEYKVNGVIQNNLKSYERFVSDKYKTGQSKPYFFILELGSKTHKDVPEGAFQFLDKSTLITSVESTLEEARRKDMGATRMYLEQYLEILDPDVGDDFFWTGMESVLWNMWNPEIYRCDDGGDYWAELFSEMELDEKTSGRVEGFEVDELFVQAVITELARSGIECNRNKTWARVRLPKNKFTYFYMGLWFTDYEDQLYLAIEISCWGGRDSYQVKEPELQQEKVFDTVKKAKSFSGLGDCVDDLVEFKNLWFDTNKDVIKKINRRSGSKRIYDSGYCLVRPVSIDDLRLICVDENKPNIFNEYIEDVKDIFELCNSK